MVPEVVWLWERYLKLKASLAQEYDVRGYTILFPLKKKNYPLVTSLTISLSQELGDPLHQGVGGEGGRGLLSLKLSYRKLILSSGTE